MATTTANLARSLRRQPSRHLLSIASTSKLLVAPCLATRVSIRSSHIGAEPLYVPPGTTLTVVNQPIRKSRKGGGEADRSQTILVSGPVGSVKVPFYQPLRLHWGEGIAASAETRKRTTTAEKDASSKPAAVDKKKINSKKKGILSSQAIHEAQQPTRGDESLDPQKLTLSVVDPLEKKQRAMWGMTRAMLSNALQGVQEGHTLVLRFVGVGYRGVVEDEPFAEPSKQDGGEKPKRLNLRLGYSHPVLIPVPKGLVASMPQQNRIVLKSTDRELIGQFAAQIRHWRQPEPYKGKGIFVGDETIKLRTAKKK